MQDIAELGAALPEASLFPGFHPHRQGSFSLNQDLQVNKLVPGSHHITCSNIEPSYDYTGVEFNRIFWFSINLIPFGV